MHRDTALSFDINFRGFYVCWFTLNKQHDIDLSNNKKRTYYLNVNECKQAYTHIIIMHVAYNYRLQHLYIIRTVEKLPCNDKQPTCYFWQRACPLSVMTREQSMYPTTIKPWPGVSPLEPVYTFLVTDSNDLKRTTLS